MRRGPKAFSRVSTWDSDIPSSCEMKDEPAFKPLQGNPAFFRVRASQCPLHLRQDTQDPSHIPRAEGSLLLRCLWKAGIPLQSKPENKFSHHDDMGCTELSSSSCVEFGVSSRLGMGVSENLWSCLKEVKQLVLFGGKRRIALEQMQENRVSSQFDLVYTELFRIAAVISGSP